MRTRFVLWMFTFIGILTACKTTNRLGYVDPDIGGVGLLLQPTRPTVQLPNQMVRMYPIRKDWLDDQISWFPLSTPSHRQGELFGIKPAKGEMAVNQWDARLHYDHDLEIKQPWYYKTWLLDEEIATEFAPGKRIGYFRFTFPQNMPKSLLMTTFTKGSLSVDATENAVSGIENFHGMKAFIYGIFSLPGQFKLLQNGALDPGVTTVTANNARAGIAFPASASATIDFKYGFSFISVEQAKQNLKEEMAGWDFEGLKKSGEMAWAGKINQIEVEGGTTAQRRSFYTALYRCYERMIDITEDGKYFSGYDGKVHTDNRPFYVDDWTWDTYLALHPLRMILHPSQEADMLQSYARMFDQSGWMPTFPLVYGDNPCMNGFHSTIVFLDAWRKGVRDYDVELAYRGMKKNAVEATMLPWKNGPAVSIDSFYREKGYYPALQEGEKDPVKEVHGWEKRQAVAVTLGHSYDDWAMGQMASDLGKKEDYQIFAKRGENYKNVYRGEKAMMWPKDKDGNWVEIDPKWSGGPGGREFYDENNGWTYLWQVQQDIPGLIGLMGGREKFVARLDQLFREGLGREKYEFWSKFPDATGNVGQFSMGNEPSFHIPYLYNYAGAPWKTQEKIRMLLDTWFKDNIFGIPGDEDGGGMSAFVVFSSLGFYPMTPGLPVYTIGSPLFEKSIVHLPNGKRFKVVAHQCSKVNKYIQSAKLNGKSWLLPWFSHTMLMDGGTLELEMGPYPNKAWGRNASVEDFNSLVNLQK